MKIFLITEEFRNVLYQNIMNKLHGTGTEINMLVTPLIKAFEATPENIKKLKTAIKEAEDSIKEAEKAQTKAMEREENIQKKSATRKKSVVTSNKKKGIK